MKKIPLFAIIIIVILFIIGTIIFKLINIDKATKNMTLADNIDKKTFKNEYESLNTEQKEDGTNKYVKITVPDDNKIKYASFDDISLLLKSGTGIIYFGFPECPWCRRILPIFFNTIKDYDVKEIYYYNALDLRDKKHLDENGNVIIDKEGDPKYYELLDLLGDNIEPYEGLNDPNIKRLYFPTIVFVQNGKIIGTQISSVDSYKSTKDDMTKEQKAELSNIFKNYIEKIYNKTSCDEETSGAC